MMRLWWSGNPAPVALPRGDDNDDDAVVADPDAGAVRVPRDGDDDDDDDDKEDEDADAFPLGEEEDDDDIDDLIAVPPLGDDEDGDEGVADPADDIEVPTLGDDEVTAPASCLFVLCCDKSKMNCSIWECQGQKMNGSHHCHVTHTHYVKKERERKDKRGKMWREEKEWRV